MTTPDITRLVLIPSERPRADRDPRVRHYKLARMRLSQRHAEPGPHPHLTRTYD